jgi:Outer membrane protein beta-barrel domain
VDGPAAGISYSTVYDLYAMQRYAGVGLTVGPRVNLRAGASSELSVAFRGGALLQHIVQPTYSNGRLLQTRYYAPALLPNVELSGRWSFWAGNGSAIELGLHYFATTESNKWMRIAREDGAALPTISAEQSQYFDEKTRTKGYMNALAVSIGARTRVGGKTTASEVSDVRKKAFQRGWIVGAQLQVPNGTTGQWSSGFHTGLFFAERLYQQLYMQIEPQIKFTQVRMPLLFFEDYAQNPIALAYGSRLAQVGSFTMLELPILLKWQSGPRHSWLLGVRPSVNTVRLYDQMGGSFVSGTSISANRFNDLGYRQAIRRFDTGISLGHELRLGPALCFSLRYTQGLFDMTHDNFFKNTETYTNSDVQTSLKLHF